MDFETIAFLLNTFFSIGDQDKYNLATSDIPEYKQLRDEIIEKLLDTEMPQNEDEFAAFTLLAGRVLDEDIVGEEDAKTVFKGHTVGVKKIKEALREQLKYDSPKPLDD